MDEYTNKHSPIYLQYFRKAHHYQCFWGAMKTTINARSGTFKRCNKANCYRFLFLLTVIVFHKYNYSYKNKQIFLRLFSPRRFTF